jgi:hypothetical protein
MNCPVTLRTGRFAGKPVCAGIVRWAARSTAITTRNFMRRTATGARQVFAAADLAGLASGFAAGLAGVEALLSLLAAAG